MAFFDIPIAVLPPSTFFYIYHPSLPKEPIFSHYPDQIICTLLLPTLLLHNTPVLEMFLYSWFL